MSALSRTEAYDFRMMYKALKATEENELEIFGVASSQNQRAQKIINGVNLRHTVYSLYEKRVVEAKRSHLEFKGSTLLSGAETPYYQDNPYDIENGVLAYSNQFYLHLHPLDELDLTKPLNPKYWMQFFPPSEDKVIYQIKLHPTSQTTLAAGSLDEVYVFDLEKGKYRYSANLRKTIPTAVDSLRSVSWNGNQTLMGSALKTITLFDLRQSGGIEFTTPPEHESVHLSARGNYVLSGGKENICLYDSRYWQKPLQIYHGHAGEVKSFLWKTDHSFYSAGDRGDGQIKLWKDSTPQALQTTHTQAAIVALKALDHQFISIHGTFVTPNHENMFNTAQVWEQTCEGLRRKEVIHLNSSEKNVPLYNFTALNKLFVVTPLVTNNATTLDVYDMNRGVKKLDSRLRFPLSELR